MQISALEASTKMSTQANRLWNDAAQLAADMGHQLLDPSHLVVAALLGHNEQQNTYSYSTASFPLIHPVRKGQDGRWRAVEGEGLELDADQAFHLVAGAYPVSTSRPLVVQHFTKEMSRTLERAYALAYEELHRSDKPYGRPEITVFNLVWAAIESDSAAVNELVPDKQRAMHVFFRVNPDNEGTAPTSVYTAVTGAMPVVRTS